LKCIAVAPKVELGPVVAKDSHGSALVEQFSALVETLDRFLPLSWENCAGLAIVVDQHRWTARKGRDGLTLVCFSDGSNVLLELSPTVARFE
jgi:hypothetical protein